MTDLERARTLIDDFALVVLPKSDFAQLIAAAERRGAAEMRERAGRAAMDHEAPTTARAILDLPLTPEEPSRRQPIAPSTDPGRSVSGRLLAAHPIPVESAESRHLTPSEQCIMDKALRKSVRLGEPSRPRPLDAATRAIAINWGYDPDRPWRGNISDDNVGEAAEAALRAVLPEEPPEWFEEWMLSYGYSDGPAFRVEAWRALRARMLGEDA